MYLLIIVIIFYTKYYKYVRIYFSLNNYFRAAFDCLSFLIFHPAVCNLPVNFRMPIFIGYFGLRFLDLFNLYSLGN